MHRLLALLLGVLLLAAACGQVEPDVVAGDDPAPTPVDTGDATPAPTGAPDPTGDPEPEQTGDPEPDPTGDPGPGPDEPNGEDGASVYFARATDGGIWVEPVEVTFDEPAVGVARAAMEALVAGPPAGADPSLETLAPAGTTVRDAAVTDGAVLVVDLSGDVRDGSAAGSSAEAAFAQQLAYTAAQFSTVERVQLWVEGSPVTELWGHVDWSRPIEPEQFALTPVTFDSHAWGEEVAVGDVTVGGEATVFEATVVLRLYGPDGALVEEAFTTATEGGPGRGDWEHTFTLATPGRWTVEVAESDPSDGEGRPPVTVQLELEAR